MAEEGAYAHEEMHRCRLPRSSGSRSEGNEPREVFDQVDDDEDISFLIVAEATFFRGIAARLNYVSTDRPDLQYAVKEAARTMSSPCAVDWNLLIQIGHELLRRPRVAIAFP